MQEHRFTLVLADLPEMTDEAAERLYQAGCDDGSPGSRNGVSHVGFDREAPSLEEAIRSAVRDVRQAGYHVERVEIERDDLEDLVRAPAAQSA